MVQDLDAETHVGVFRAIAEASNSLVEAEHTRNLWETFLLPSQGRAQFSPLPIMHVQKCSELSRAKYTHSAETLYPHRARQFSYSSIG